MKFLFLKFLPKIPKYKILGFFTYGYICLMQSRILSKNQSFTNRENCMYEVDGLNVDIQVKDDPEEGLVNVHIAEIQTTLAFPALTKKLEQAGWSLLQGTLETKVRFATNVDDANWTALSNVLVSFVFTDWQYAFIEQKLEQTHTYLTSEELEYITLLVFYGLRKYEGRLGGSSLTEWEEILYCAFTEILIGQHIVDIEGVIRFRMRSYLQSVEEAIHETVDQFLVDREYEEFVAMLRYILESQPLTEQVLHVFASEERVWICDAYGALVRDTEVTQAVLETTEQENEEMNAEDLAMSILITRSPCEIVVHDLSSAAPWPSFAETLDRVFLGRAHRCGHCSTCQQLLQANLHVLPQNGVNLNLGRDR